MVTQQLDRRLAQNRGDSPSDALVAQGGGLGGDERVEKRPTGHQLWNLRIAGWWFIAEFRGFDPFLPGGWNVLPQPKNCMVENEKWLKPPPMLDGRRSTYHGFNA